MSEKPVTVSPENIFKIKALELAVSGANNHGTLNFEVLADKYYNWLVKDHSKVGGRPANTTTPGSPDMTPVLRGLGKKARSK